MLRIVTEKKKGTQKNSISGLQALIVSTATRVGMGNLVGVVAGWGLVGICIAMACYECIRAVVFLFRCKSGAWKNKSFVQPKEKVAPEQA